MPFGMMAESVILQPGRTGLLEVTGNGQTAGADRSRNVTLRSRRHGSRSDRHRLENAGADVGVRLVSVRTALRRPRQVPRLWCDVAGTALPTKMAST